MGVKAWLLVFLITEADEHLLHVKRNNTCASLKFRENSTQQFDHVLYQNKTIFTAMSASAAKPIRLLDFRHVMVRMPFTCISGIGFGCACGLVIVVGPKFGFVLGLVSGLTCDVGLCVCFCY